MKRVQNSTSDIISALPTNITENILECLPLRDAVRTSVLSRNWRYKWVTLPELVFDEKLCKQPPGNKKLETIIYQVLLLHNGPLVKFKLSVPKFKICLDIDNWILILLKKNIQEFTLHIYMGQYYKLPCHLFSFLQLKHLSLSTCIFKPPPTFRGFSSLVNLQFHDVFIVHEMFGHFISNCPLLEQLCLVGCNNFDCLKINAPNLKFFSFRGFFTAISFRNTSLLAEICIALFSVNANANQHEEGKDSNLFKFFHCIPAIKNLNLDSHLLEFLAVGSVPKVLPRTLNRLKILDLSNIYFEKIDQVSCALCLIRSSPNLQELKITAFTCATNLEPVVEFLQAQDFSKFSLNHLQVVEFQLFSGVEPEMQFVKFLLANSPALEKMEIVPVEEHFSNEAFRTLKELTRFSRASPKAELIYSED